MQASQGPNLPIKIIRVELAGNNVVCCCVPNPVNSNVADGRYRAGRTMRVHARCTANAVMCSPTLVCAPNQGWRKHCRIAILCFQVAETRAPISHELGRMLSKEATYVAHAIPAHVLMPHSGCMSIPRGQIDRPHVAIVEVAWAHG